MSLEETIKLGKIEFTKYILPNGRKEKVFFIAPMDVVQKGNKILEKGYRFEIEELRTGQISMTISDPIEEMDVDIRICNKDKINENINDMISNFKIK